MTVTACCAVFGCCMCATGQSRACLGRCKCLMVFYLNVVIVGTVWFNHSVLQQQQYSPHTSQSTLSLLVCNMRATTNRFMFAIPQYAVWRKAYTYLLCSGQPVHCSTARPRAAGTLAVPCCSSFSEEASQPSVSSLHL